MKHAHGNVTSKKTKNMMFTTLVRLTSEAECKSEKCAGSQMHNW